MNVPTSNLAYYAANAPESPDWFTATPLDLPDPATPDENTLPSGDRAAAIAYRDSGTPLPGGASDALKAFAQVVDRWKLVKTTYANQRAGDAFFQWRWYYAGQMLKRERATT